MSEHEVRANHENGARFAAQRRNVIGTPEPGQ